MMRSDVSGEVFLECVGYVESEDDDTITLLDIEARRLTDGRAIKPWRRGVFRKTGASIASMEELSASD
jgi:hypothetical protein